MTRRGTTLTLALLLTAAACSSEASSGTSVAVTTAPDATSTTVLATTVVPDPGATTSTAAAATTAPPTASTAPTPPPPTPAPSTATCHEVGLNETVQRGDCGDTVTFIQERLTVLGFPVTADGQFGPGTERVVKDFQTSRGLTADGIVGEATWAKLVEGGIGD